MLCPNHSIIPFLFLSEKYHRVRTANKILIGENRQERIMRKRKHTCNKSNQDRGNRVTIDVEEKREKKKYFFFLSLSRALIESEYRCVL